MNAISDINQLFSDDHREQYGSKGYFIVKNLITRDQAMEIRGIIKDCILRPEPDETAESDPMDPMGNSPQARQARFRKLNEFCRTSPLIMANVFTNEKLLSIVRQLLGDNLLLKFDSCFLKPAKTGSATPWHQDNGLWRDGDTQSFNFWMAIDPATKANGCLQFIPGTHKSEITEHVTYEDSIHGELPHEKVKEMSNHYGIEHIELEPGDIVCWHSSLYHYSPPNYSDKGRIAIAGVMTTPGIALSHPKYFTERKWLMRDGVVIVDFPTPDFTEDARPLDDPGAYPEADKK